MEDFSQNQLITLIFLMFSGNEILISSLGLFLTSFKLNQTLNNGVFFSAAIVDQAERDLEISKKKLAKSVGFIALGSIMIIHVLGSISVFFYITYDSNSRNLLKKKGINRIIFSIFLTVSTCSRCGFVPTNESMIVFRKNTWLLLIIISQIIGTALFAPFLRFSIWVCGKCFKKCEYFEIVLQNGGEIEFGHLVSRRRSWWLVGTYLGFVFVQFVLFCCMEWRSVSLNGLNGYEKLVGILFQCINTRHTGEVIVDLSLISPALLVLFILMMYLPPYTTFFPVAEDNGEERISSKNLIISEVSYLVVTIIILCITEMENIKKSPLNFSIFNIVLEVISAYGNVGYSMGYSCERELTPQQHCENKWYGFSGKWSNEGKIIIIVLMIFGRLRMPGFNGGGAWKLFYG